RSLPLPMVAMGAAEMVPAGPYVAPGRGPAPAAAPAVEGRGRGRPGGPPAAPPLMLPAHCRVNAILRPSSDSEIEMEAWLPENWHGKFQFVGGRGRARTVRFPPVAHAPLRCASA